MDEALVTTYVGALGKGYDPADLVLFAVCCEAPNAGCFLADPKDNDGLRWAYAPLTWERALACLTRTGDTERAEATRALTKPDEVLVVCVAPDGTILLENEKRPALPSA